MAKPINCEDTSDEEGWSYCGKRECVSCGVGDEKKASNDRAFHTGWSILKDDGCEECGEEIPNGKQYGCERCGRDFCEECLMNDQYGHTGFRGEIDKDHPAYDHLDGAHCGECASEIAQEVEDEAQYEVGEREMEDEMQIEDLPEEEKKLHFANKISELLNIDPPNPFSQGPLSDFTDKWASEDSFDRAWSIVKGGVKGWLHDMVYEVKDLVENQQSHPMEAARFVAEQNDPTDRKLGRLLFAEYVRMSDEGLI